MRFFRHIILAVCAMSVMAVAAQETDPVISAITDAYRQAKVSTQKNKSMGNEMVTTLNYTVKDNGRTTETLHFYYNTVRGTYLLTEDNDPHFFYYPLYLVTRQYNIGKKKYNEEFLFDPDSQRLLFALTQDYDENGKRFDRQFYFHNGTVYRVVGPETDPMTKELIIYQADELRHAFDWIIRNPKE